MGPTALLVGGGAEILPVRLLVNVLEWLPDCPAKVLCSSAINNLCRLGKLRTHNQRLRASTSEEWRIRDERKLLVRSSDANSQAAVEVRKISIA
jgi:hypothetical protein